MSKASLPGRPLVGVLAVVRRGPRVLLVQRTQAGTAGRWTFPGGHLEFGETLTAGAMRELLEETGVAADPSHLLPPLDYIRDGDGAAPRMHYVLVPVVADWRAGEGAAGDDAGDVRWVTLAELEAGMLPLLDHVVRLARSALA